MIDFTNPNFELTKAQDNYCPDPENIVENFEEAITIKHHAWLLFKPKVENAETESK